MDRPMAEAERHRLERMFHELDANNDGRVDPKELAEGVKKMGYYHVTEEQIIVRYFFDYMYSCRVITESTTIVQNLDSKTFYYKMIKG